MMVTVLHRHIRQLGYCNKGARVFFERHGLNWADFMANGISADVLGQIDDDMARCAIAQAEREQQDGR